MHFERRPPLLRMPAYPVHYTILHTYARFKLTLHASVTTKHTSRLRPLHQQAAAPSRARCMHCKLFMHFQRASLRRKRPHHHQAHNAPCCFTRYSRTWLTWRVLPCRRHAWKNSAARCSADPHPGWLETFAGRLQRGVSLVSESQASPGGGGGATGAGVTGGAAPSRSFKVAPSLPLCSLSNAIHRAYVLTTSRLTGSGRLAFKWEVSCQSGGVRSSVLPLVRWPAAPATHPCLGPRHGGWATPPARVFPASG